jgi:predicted outer membrane repeat protein
MMMRLYYPVLTVFVLTFFLTLSTSYADNFFPTTTEELIEDIQTANSNAQPDIINLVPGMVYTITGNEPGVPFENGNGNNGLPIILEDVIPFGITIIGNGATIERDPNLFVVPDFPCSGDGLKFRIFEVEDQAALLLFDLTLRYGCGVNGGAVLSESPVSTIFMDGVSVLRNSATENGGGVSTDGDLMVDESDVSHNRATINGGGIHIEGSECTLTLTDSTVMNNFAGVGGGLSIADSIANIRRSEINNNASLAGGMNSGGAGIYSDFSTVDIKNTDINGNIASGGDAQGGGIFNVFGGTMTIERSEIKGNQMIGGGNSSGAGIANLSASVTLTDSEVYGNTADFGGGIQNVGMDAEFDILSSKISMNLAISGGGISNIIDATMNIYHSAIVRNMANVDTGGIINNAELNILNTTISGNESNVTTGGISVSETSSTSLTFVTLADNTSGSVGGLGANDAAAIDIKNTLIVGNPPDNCTLNDASFIMDDGGNISDQIFDDCGIFFNGFFITPTMLGPLAHNGGDTLTHALNTTIDPNPAINNIAIADCTDKDGAPVTTDQRGFQRPFPTGGDCDTGAFEAQPNLNGFNGQPADEAAVIKNRQNKITVINVTPQKKIFIAWGFKKGNGTVNGAKCNGTPVGINPFQIIASLKANGKGIVNKKLFIPSTSANKAFLQVILNNCTTLPVQQVILLND